MERKTLKESYLEEVENLKLDAYYLRIATDYCDSGIIKDDILDTTERASKRMQYVKEAEKEIIKKYMKEILFLASKHILNDIE